MEAMEAGSDGWSFSIHLESRGSIEDGCHVLGFQSRKAIGGFLGILKPPHWSWSFFQISEAFRLALTFFCLIWVWCSSVTSSLKENYLERFAETSSCHQALSTFLTLFSAGISISYHGPPVSLLSTLSYLRGTVNALRTPNIPIVEYGTEFHNCPSVVPSGQTGSRWMQVSRVEVTNLCAHVCGEGGRGLKWGRPSFSSLLSEPRECEKISMSLAYSKKVNLDFLPGSPSLAWFQPHEEHTAPGPWWPQMFVHDINYLMTDLHL